MTGRPPSVTVVVATRDRPAFLRQALAAILAQDYPGRLECLVVFDQSDVVLPEAGVKGERSVRGMRNERTPGLAGGRNTGILAATGDLIAFCDDDDFWFRTKLRRQVEALTERPDAAAASCGIVIAREGGTSTRVPAEETIEHADLLRSRRLEVHPSTVLVDRTTVLEEIGLVDEEIPGSYAEDYEWLLRVARATPIVLAPEALVRVRWHEASWFAHRWDTIAAALPYLVAKHPELEQEPRGLARIYGRLAFACAAGGRSGDARAWAARTWRLDPRQMRSYLALAVSLGLIRPDTVVRLAHAFGRGV